MAKCKCRKCGMNVCWVLTAEHPLRVVCSLLPTQKYMNQVKESLHLSWRVWKPRHCQYAPVKCTVVQMHEGTLSWDGWRASWMVSLLRVVISRLRMHCKLKEMEQQDKVCVLMLYNAGKRSKIPYRLEPQLTTYRNQYVGQPAKPVCFLCM